MSQSIQGITYTTAPFDYNKAMAQQLCAVVRTQGQTQTILGTGIVYQPRAGQLDITVNEIKYSFNNSGDPISSTAINCYLMMAISQLNGNNSGDISHSVGQAYTRSVDEDGNVSFASATPSTSIVIDELNARDEFAIKALQGMLSKIPDPSVLSKNEMTRYCEAAYVWASFMMDISSKTRSVIIDDPDSEAQSSEMTILPDSPVEKLLHNIKIALKRTDYEEEDPEDPDNKIYSERIINPKMNKLTKDYLKYISDNTGEVAPYTSDDPDDPSNTKYWNYETALKLLWRSQYKKDDQDEESNTAGSYSQRIINPKQNTILKKFFKHTSGVGELGSDLAAFEDLVKLGQNLQETLDNKKYQRVVLYKWDEFKTVLTDIKTGLTTLNTTLTNVFATQHQDMQAINSSLQAFTTAVDTRLSNIQTAVGDLQTDVTDIKSNYATSSNVSDAKDDIIDAMPTCRYNPPTD